MSGIENTAPLAIGQLAPDGDIVARMDLWLSVVAGCMNPPTAEGVSQIARSGHVDVERRPGDGRNRKGCEVDADSVASLERGKVLIDHDSILGHIFTRRRDEPFFRAPTRRRRELCPGAVVFLLSWPSSAANILDSTLRSNSQINAFSVTTEKGLDNRPLLCYLLVYGVGCWKRVSRVGNVPSLICNIWLGFDVNVALDIDLKR